MKTVLLIGFLVGFGFATVGSAASGQEIWADQCATCHGPDGKAQTPMGKKRQIKSFADAKVLAGMTDDAMFQTIKNGKKGSDGKTLMPAAEKVTDEDIKALVKVVRSFKP